MAASGREGRNTGGRVVSRAVDQGWTPDKGPEDRRDMADTETVAFRMGYVLVQPEAIDLRMQNDGHPVVYGGDQGIGRCGQDRDGLQRSAFRSFPCFPDAGQTHGHTAGQANIIWRFMTVFGFPFVKTGSRNNTSPEPDGVSKCRFLRKAFAVGIDHPASDRNLFCP
jgi:hypothetical protein